MAESPFSTIPPSEWVAHNDLAFAVRDRHGVSKGHTLVISRRVVATWFDASREEQLAILSLIDEVKRALDEDLHPDGYNVGFNAGEAAGQTVMHLHVHVIPRSRGDMDDPRGGVRHVIPSKGNYLRDARPMSTGGEGDPFARHVLPNAVGPAVVSSVFGVASVVLLEAAMSFLGMGVESRVASWGETLAEGARDPARLRLLLLPGGLLVATVGGSYLLASALRDATDPRASEPRASGSV